MFTVKQEIQQAPPSMASVSRYSDLILRNKTRFSHKLDNHVCIVARQDGKILVTSLWVRHSLDVGIPVDASPVMYRPMKDLNEISAAKNIVMCLTDHQRQDREDIIMTMVGLMGAQFSKPLVANRVTHLICYKFEVNSKSILTNKGSMSLDMAAQLVLGTLETLMN